MATKRKEPCPQCGVETLPVDNFVSIASPYGTVQAIQWRYECPICEWSWTNKVQRENNKKFYRRARAEITPGFYGG